MGVPQHVIQRGNDRQVYFGCDEHFAAYAHWLREAAEWFEVGIHAWVFMTNHVHLLATLEREKGLSRMMQQLGRQYVRHFNHRYGRSETLWEGRFKVCLVQESEYLLGCYRYIELNPVRAGMVADRAKYRWSNYRANALGLESALRTPHAEYLALGKGAGRLGAYRALFRPHVDDELIAEIRRVTDHSMALGNDRFRAEMEALTGVRQRPGPMGRPPAGDGEQSPERSESLLCPHFFKKLASGEEKMIALASVPEQGRLTVHAGKRHTTLRRQELEEYWSERGKRGHRLPRGFRKVDAVEVEI